MELTRMLYEGAMQAVQEAMTAHRGGDILARGNAVTKAVEILGELRFSLRRDVAPQYCDTLSGLYGYLQRRLIQAHAEKSEGMLQEVIRIDPDAAGRLDRRDAQSGSCGCGMSPRMETSGRACGRKRTLQPRIRLRTLQRRRRRDGGSESELAVLAWPRSRLAVTIFAIPSPP